MLLTVRSSMALTIAVPALLSLCLAVPAHAQSVYVSGSNGEFGTMNVSNGAFTPIGTTPQTFFGIAFAPDGTLYGLEDSSTPGLYKIDPATAATTLVGPTGIDGFAYGLAFRPDGTLFTMDSASTLFTLNPATGAASTVGAIGNSSNGTVEFDDTGTLYETDTSTDPDTLVRLDQTTGAGTPVGPTGFRFIYGLGEVGGTMYGFDTNFDIISIDLATGAGTFVTTYALPNGNVVEDATVPIQDRFAPEPGSLAFVGTMGLCGVGWLARRRRR